MKSLLNTSILRLGVCIIVILLLCAPLFYYLTVRFYAEDLNNVITAVHSGTMKEQIDLKEDIAVGMMLQYALIAAILAVAITIRFVTSKLWKPFDITLQAIETFRLERDKMPTFPSTNIKEFERLNRSVSDLIQRDIGSYKIQKEFTENASHELQTPLAVIRSKLDLLIQEKLNENETQIVQNIYDVTNSLAHLNRNLLLLAKIENNQYEDTHEIYLKPFLENLLPQYSTISFEPMTFTVAPLTDIRITANSILLEILINNLVTNALNHNLPGHPVHIDLKARVLTITNASLSGPLDSVTLFERFRHSHSEQKETGLGLAIAKQICNFHHWTLTYSYVAKCHLFSVNF